MTEGRATSGFAAGVVLFAGLMMLMVGIWQALEGLIGIFENEFYVATRKYLFQFDATTWGWIHLILGIVLVCTGLGLFAGQGWARWTAIFFAMLNAFGQIAWMSTYPLWSVLIITLDIIIIYQLTARWETADW